MKKSVLTLISIYCGLLQGMENQKTCDAPSPKCPHKQYTDTFMEQLSVAENLLHTNPRAGRALLEKLHESYPLQHSVIATFELARCHEEGIGGAQDVAKARQYYQTLKKQNSDPHITVLAGKALMMLTESPTSGNKNDVY